MTGTAADRAATWYAEGRPESGPARPASRPPSLGPRALEARGLVTVEHILVQLGDIGLRPRFAESCKAFGDIIWCDDIDELLSRSAARQALAVVVDRTDRWGRSSAGVVASIRQRRPALPVVLWCERLSGPDPALAELATAGISAIIFRDESEFELRLLSALTRATDVTYTQLTDQALSRRVPEALAPVVRFVLDRATAMPSTAEIAQSVGLTTRQLAGELRRAGLPSVAALVRWSRLLTAVYRLERTPEPVGVIARSVGFASTSVLARLLRRYANETPGSVREPGGFGWVLRCFERFLTKRR